MEILQFLVNNALFVSFCSAFGVVAGVLVAVIGVVALAILGVLFLGLATSFIFFIAGFLKRIYWRFSQSSEDCK